MRLASECSRREHKSDNTCGDVATQAGFSSFALIAREITKVTILRMPIPRVFLGRLVQWLLRQPDDGSSSDEDRPRVQRRRARGARGANRAPRNPGGVGIQRWREDYGASSFAVKFSRSDPAVWSKQQHKQFENQFGVPRSLFDRLLRDLRHCNAAAEPWVCCRALLPSCAPPSS